MAACSSESQLLCQRRLGLDCKRAAECGLAVCRQQAVADNDRLRQLQEAEAACEADAIAAAKAVAHRSELRHRLEIQASTAPLLT